MATQLTLPNTPDLDYVRTIAALTIVLELLERKMKQIRGEANSQEHAAVQGHIRTALNYERQVLAQLTDPRGMAALTAGALREMLAVDGRCAVALLETSNEAKRVLNARDARRQR